jgi:hypothetical protein
VPQQGDVLVLPHQVKLSVIVVDLVQRCTEGYLALLYANVNLSFLLHKHLKYGNICIDVFSHIAHFWVGGE